MQAEASLKDSGVSGQSQGHSPKPWDGGVCAPGDAAPVGLTFPGGHVASSGGHLHFGLLALPALLQQLALEGSHRTQQVPALHLRRWDHNAAVQELADGAQEVLPVIRLVGSLVKQLQGRRPWLSGKG